MVAARAPPRWSCRRAPWRSRRRSRRRPAGSAAASPAPRSPWRGRGRRIVIAAVVLMGCLGLLRLIVNGRRADSGLGRGRALNVKLTSSIPSRRASRAGSGCRASRATPRSYRFPAGTLLQLEPAARLGDREVRMLQHAGVGGHPAVHVALEADHHFRRREEPRVLLLLDLLAEVEFLVDVRQRVHVVHGGVAVDELDVLPDPDAEDVRRRSGSPSDRASPARSATSK